MRRLGFPALLCGLTTAVLSAQTVDQCRALNHHGKLAEAQTCFSRLAAGSNPYARAEGLWALERYQDANEQFKALVKQEPKNALYRIRWGYLFLERFNPNEAGNLFNEALE